MIEDFLSDEEELGGLFFGIAVALVVEMASILLILGYLKLAGWVEGLR